MVKRGKASFPVVDGFAFTWEFLEFPVFLGVPRAHPGLVRGNIKTRSGL
jgi:hypothetical protein